MTTTANSYIKTPSEAEIMRKGGKILAGILSQLKSQIAPGVSTWQLEETFIRLTQLNNVEPSCKGYAPYGLSPFPTGLCVSVNNQSVHCIPSHEKILQSGDIITIDTVIRHQGLHVDAAFAAVVGSGTSTTKRTYLLKTAKTALENAAAVVKPGIRIGVISHTLQKTVEQSGFNVIRSYGGHGIGKDMHEWPEILCYGSPKSGEILKPGMAICIEALVCEGKPKIKHLGMWETQMEDGKDFCQFEHTILITKSGCEVLTQ